MPSERISKYIPEDESVAEPDYNKTGPSDSDLRLIERKYIQTFDAEEIETSPLDIHHDREGLAQYMADIKPYLRSRFNTKAEDNKMFKEGDYNGLFFSVAKMVVSQAFKHSGSRLSPMDLIQAGNLVVYERAIPTYKPKGDAKFSTWAMWWIRMTMVKEADKNFNGYNISGSDLYEARKVQRAEFELMSQTGRSPTRKEIADATGFPVKKVDFLRDIHKKKAVFLNDPFNFESESVYSDVIADKNAINGEALERTLTFNLTLQDVYKETQNFPARNKRNAEMLMLRLGCDKDGVWTGKIWTPTEIGRLYGLTRERVNQLQWRAVDLIKNPQLQEIMRNYIHNNT